MTETQQRTLNMLAQILHDLYVPQELLDELSEDQKQLLFCKMREEQVRRYHQRENNENGKPTVNVNKKKKQVTFRLDADGNEWCWVMGESPENNDEQLMNRIDNENMEIDHPIEHKSLSITHAFPTKNGVYYTVHRDERKQIEEISNNIQEARRIFERLETETRRLALSRENDLLQKQQQQQTPPRCQSDFVDEVFYHEIEERAKKAELEKREVARRARDYFHRHSSHSDISFDTNDQTTFALQPLLLNSSHRTIPVEKKVQIEFNDKQTPAFPLISADNPEKVEIKKQVAVTIADYQRSKPLSPITRADIRQWFRLNEIPHGAFRSPKGQIYPWFHGIISRAYTEQLLLSKPVGSYLIRISEKILGYVLSYHASDHCRHLLIEVIEHEHSYRFLGGAKKESFENLNQVIGKYTNTPIRAHSTDVLRFPCDQIDPEHVDYADLFVENIENDKLYESLYISLDTTTSSLQSTTHL